MVRFLALALAAMPFFSIAANAEIRSWRVGDAEHPWTLRPVSGRIDFGRSWAVELLVDDDGDGLIDEDPIELIDNDGDALFNEDGPDPQIDNDGDGLLNEDPVNNIDDDGDGQIDEDPAELFDNDFDGLIDEDGPDPQIDNDGDGLLNEDGFFSNLDDDYDGVQNEDPPNGVDDDGDGLIDEDGPLPVHDATSNVTTWLQPIRLDSLRNLSYLVNQRYLEGEFGGIAPGRSPERPFMVVPSEFGFRRESADPISADYWGTSAVITRADATKMADGNPSTAYGSALLNRGGVGVNLMGFYYINRIVFRPRPTLPDATIANYYINAATPNTIDNRNENLQASRLIIPLVQGEFNPTVKDISLDPPQLLGRIDIISRDPNGIRVETAEAQLYGDGFPVDGAFISEMIDVGTPQPRVRRYDREIEQFANSDRDNFISQFPDEPGNQVNWGRVRWRGRRINDKGNVRIQFRVGNTLDTHVYARRLGPGLSDTRDENGIPLDLFTWIKLADGRVEGKDLQYNEFGADLGSDGRAGWSFWSAPFKFEDGLIDESLPAEEWKNAGVQLPLPGGTRYVQFRILFDSTQESAIQLDFIEFDYDSPLVAGGVLTEIFPAQVPLGEETSFRYFMRPLFSQEEVNSFNRIEIAVPSMDTRIETLFFDGQEWNEQSVETSATSDPLVNTRLGRLAPASAGADSLGQFAQSTVLDPVSQTPKLLIKVPQMRPADFQFGQNIEIVFRSKLFRGSKEFTSSVWNDATGDINSAIPQPTTSGDATPDIATNAVLVVVNDIDQILQAPNVLPNPFTPNGDGLNDEIVFSFDLFLVLEQIDVQLTIYDLSGRPIHRLETANSSAGSVQIRWDGRDANGNLVPPGLYLYHLEVGSDDAASEYSGTISLVY
jgi:hypothetical protein